MGDKDKPRGRILMIQSKVQMAVKFGAEVTSEDIKEIDFALSELLRFRNAVSAASKLDQPVSVALAEHVTDDDIIRVAEHIKLGQDP